MSKNTLEERFKELQGQFDLAETPDGHQARFMQKLQSGTASESKGSFMNWWKPLSIAASVLVIVSLGFLMRPEQAQGAELASVSPELEQAESFFVTTIEKELSTLQSYENESTKVIIEDALVRLQRLENEYDKLKIDLVESGNDRRVIHAMIENFQSRIELLQQVIQTIEEIEETLKANQNETTV